MPWNRKTTRKHRHARNRHRTAREKLARARAWIDSDEPVIGRPLPSLWFAGTNEPIFKNSAYAKAFSRSECES